MRRFVSSLVLFLLVATLGTLLLGRHRAPSLTQPVVPQPALAETLAEGPYMWAGALNSAREDGAGFFDPRRAERFIARFPENQRPYIIHLVSRAFLPEPGCAAFNGEPDSAPALAYLQFHAIPDARERAALAAAGIDLSRYVAGLSWRVHAPLGTLRRLAARESVRSITPVDPRDKLHPLFWFEGAPSYARNGGRVEISGIFRADAADADTQRVLDSLPLARMERAHPSVLGQRITVSLPEAQASAPAEYQSFALALARSADVLYVEPPPPPVVARDTVGTRDVNTDEQSNIGDVRDSGQLLNGSGVSIAVREVGRPNAHIDFSSRLTEVDVDGATDQGNRDHATQVLGQVGGQGFNNPSAKGVAPAATLLSYATGSPAFATTDVSDARNRGARISNHSYGPTGSSLRFGTYESVSADWDAALRTNDQLGFFAGYEERNLAQPYKKHDYFVGAKNTILVSSTNVNAHAGDDAPPRAKADGLADFSVFGPMNDGRIKPDLMTFGDGVNLTTGTGGESVNFGTSFSTPAAAGIGALLLQHYRNVTNTEPSAAMLKALLCNTASDLGNPGPDAQYGFGLINAEAAVNLVSLGASPALAPFRESSIGGTSSNGNIFTTAIQVDAPAQLRVTLCWFDPAGDPLAAKPLVNDLNLSLIDPNGVVYFPFSLNPNNPQANATALAPNTVDPIEHIVVDAQATGSWIVTVSGTVPTGTQNFALVSNRPPVQIPVTADILASPKRGPAPLLVSFQAGTFDFGGNATYEWKFGDGTLGSGFNVTHTYTVPSPASGYLVELTVTANGVVKTDTETIFVDRRSVDSFGSKATLSMKFAGDTLSDDSLQFALVIPELVRTPQQAREAYRDGTFEGTAYRLYINDTLMRTVLLSRRAQYKDSTLQFGINLARGEATAKFKKIALESILNLNSDTPDQNFTFDVRLENDELVYNGTLTVQYSSKNGRGRGKYPFKR